MVSILCLYALQKRTAPQWSEAVGGLRCRIEVERRGEKGSSPKIVPFLRLQNVTDVLGTVDIYLSSGNLVLWLEDSQGNKLQNESEGVNGRNGFVPNPFWLQLPVESEIRFRADLDGYFIPNPSILVIESESGLLSVPKGYKRAVYLGGSFVVNDPPHEARGHRWEGTLRCPRILIFDGRNLVDKPARP